MHYVYIRRVRYTKESQEIEEQEVEVDEVRHGSSVWRINPIKSIVNILVYYLATS